MNHDGDFTLIHFSDNLDVLMDAYDTLDDALDAVLSIPPDRQVYLSVRDVGAPNGISVTRIERSESGNPIRVEPSRLQAMTLHDALAERPVARSTTRKAAVEKTVKVLSERLGEVPKGRGVVISC